MFVKRRHVYSMNDFVCIANENGSKTQHNTAESIPFPTMIDAKNPANLVCFWYGAIESIIIKRKYSKETTRASNPRARERERGD